MPLRLNGSTSGYSQLDAPAIAGDQTFTLPGTGGTIDRLNRAGNILQVVNAATSTAVTSTSTSFADTGLSANITLSASTSKVLVLIKQQLYLTNLALAAGLYRTSIGVIALRNSTQISANSSSDTGGRYGIHLAISASASNQVIAGYWGGMFLDTPGSGTHTYKTQFAVGSAGNTAFAQVGAGYEQSTITLLEVAA